MKKILVAFLGCAGFFLLTSGALRLWSSFREPNDVLAGMEMTIKCLAAFWAGIFFLALAAAVALVLIVLSFVKFKKEQGRCSRTANDAFVIEHLP